jgi:hypothetical protein
MSARMRENHWQMTAQRRRKPGAGDQIRIASTSTEAIAADPANPPCEIVLEATTSSGEPAAWLDDYFWVALLQAWSHVSLTVRFAATPRALLNPVVMHHANMLRRVATNWRVVGLCHVHDLEPEGAVTQIAQSPYHEIHIVDEPRGGESRPAHALRIDDAVARIRRVQVANGRTMPIILCARQPRPQPSVQPAAPTARPARQRGVLNRPTCDRPVHAS